MRIGFIWILTILALLADAQSEWERAGLGGSGPGMPSGYGLHIIIRPADDVWRRRIGTNVYNLKSDQDLRVGGWTQIMGGVIQESGGYILVSSGLNGADEVALTNYPTPVTSTTKISVAAAKAGIFKFADVPLQIWDCGVPYIPTPEEIAAEKKAKDDAVAAAKAKVAAQKQRADAIALKSNQDLAAKDDPYGLLRMGERYRDGEGVEKDLAKARKYLQLAAEADFPDAKEELSRLPDAANQPH